MMPQDKFQSALGNALGEAHDAVSRELLEANGLSYEDAINDTKYLHRQGFELLQHRNSEDEFEFVLAKRTDVRRYRLTVKVEGGTELIAEDDGSNEGNNGAPVEEPKTEDKAK